MGYTVGTCTISEVVCGDSRGMTKRRGLVVVSGNGVGTVSENTAVVLMVWVVIVVVVGDSRGL